MEELEKMSMAAKSVCVVSVEGGPREAVGEGARGLRLVVGGGGGGGVWWGGEVWKEWRRVGVEIWWWWCCEKEEEGRGKARRRRTWRAGREGVGGMLRSLLLLLVSCFGALVESACGHLYLRE